MSKYLVIVESPTKARTEYEIVSSMGHVVDLPSSRFAIDIENGFQPVYRVIPGKEKTIQQLKSKSKHKKIVYLATDFDREGEAISWHIREKLARKGLVFKRVVFHEITDSALEHAFKHPHTLDMRKVNAQIARRVLDRVVGYNLSPLLWKKIVRGLSAGRVQSIALKFIVEREKEIQQFIPKTTYSIEARFRSGQEVFKAKLNKYKGKKIIFEDKRRAEAHIEAMQNQDFLVKALQRRQTSRKPAPPYITSLLQQDAFTRLRFSAQRTMLIAQKLYEGTQIGAKSVGLITYMRTDSFHISAEAKRKTKDFVHEVFGDKYLSLKEHRYKKKKGAQLAHEAIRPTSIYRKPQELEKYLSGEELKLYTLIWKRFVATFMKDALYESTKVFINSKEAEFEATGRKIIFDGYLKVYDEPAPENPLPDLKKGERLALEDLTVVENTTKPPPRYNDASIVRLLEEKGIGRPSTYAPTIYTLLKRNYAKRERRVFIPTDLGVKVSNLLVKFFPKVMDENFTAFMEDELDEVEKGLIKWNKVLEEFYPGFKRKVDETLRVAKKEVDFSDKFCPQCKGRLVVKWSRRGRFLSCEHFPKCRYAESITTGVSCPECKSGQLIERRNKRGQNFYGCSSFPQCTYTSRHLPDNSENAEDEANSDS